MLSRVAGLPGLPARFTPVGRARNLYRRVQKSADGFKLQALLEEMRIHLRVNAADESRIPAAGPLVVVANHPYGVLDGAILTVLLTRVRPDVRILTNFLLDDVPELAEHCIFVDPFHTDRSIELNRRAMREALAWLEGGGALAIFPAGEVSHWQMPPAHVADPAWNDTAVRLIRRSGASALPVYFCGHNGVTFQILGMIHPKLRTGFLLEQFLQQEGKSIEVRIGSEIQNDELSEIEDDRQAIEYLRWRTYLLGRRKKSEVIWPAAWRAKLASKIQEPLCPAVDPDLLAREVASLPKERCLAENGDLAVYLGTANLTPHCLEEIGRLRELTFRQVGEGTGKASDLDTFDDYYWHLLLWNRKKQELVGAYRAGSTAEILPVHGVGGLYTSTLFRYDECLFQKLGSALELGRSFVRPEYQRQFAPLMLLWKGIARLVASRPDIPVLFGPVSISNDYCKASREMIFRFFEARMHEDELAGMVQPRNPFRPGLLQSWDCHGMSQVLRDLEQLSQPITDVETDGKGLPILLRQYAKIGGRLLGFNVDRKFSNCLDGLIVVDLRRTDPSVLERYMGKESATRFRQLHSTPR
ncbi:MAG TPA: GNAT family N-acyltransferase [Candidatus Sulfotelmatobacter sp.]|nr:GNAT family N-acyltransferase [Candidatus Sulfotelmatobacter sp.]